MGGAKDGSATAGVRGVSFTGSGSGVRTGGVTVTICVGATTFAEIGGGVFDAPEIVANTGGISRFLGAGASSTTFVGGGSTFFTGGSAGLGAGAELVTAGAALDFFAERNSTISRSGFDSWPKLSRHVSQLRELEGTWEFATLEVEGNPVSRAMMRLMP